MSSRRRLVALAGALGCALVITGCHARGFPIGEYGRPVVVQMPTYRLEGELLAVAPDTLWLLSGPQLTPVATALARQLYVQRHDYGMGRTVRTMAWSGLATGVALMVSCLMYESSADGSGDGAACLLVVPVTAATFAGVGVVLGAINSMTTHKRYDPAQLDRVRPFARYPQGMPESMRPLPQAP